MHQRAAIAAAVLGLVLMLGGCYTQMYEYSVSPYEYSGVRLYQVFCSSCHGLIGRGDGPVAPLFRAGAPDLAHLAARNAGKFPREEVRSAIDGRETFLAHGSSEMPVWGFEFYEGGSAKAARRRADDMIDRIVKYLEDNQVQ
jgi:mono/diheme cytochrome c family protein